MSGRVIDIEAARKLRAARPLRREVPTARRFRLVLDSRGRLDIALDIEGTVHRALLDPDATTGIIRALFATLTNQELAKVSKATAALETKLRSEPLGARPEVREIFLPYEDCPNAILELTPPGPTDPPQPALTVRGKRGRPGPKPPKR